MTFGRYELLINFDKFGDHATLKACWEILEREYGKLPDQYEGELHWEIHDPFEGKRGCSFTMPAALWYALCEDSRAFSMYLDIAGWKKRTKEARRQYAARRMSLAVDRVIRGDKSVGAVAWVNAWARAAGIHKFV